MPSTVHVRGSAIEWTEVVHCRGCARGWRARIAVEGFGVGSATLGLRRQTAADKAALDAFSNATTTGERMIRLARCPACNARIGDDLGGLVLRNFFVAGVVSLIAYALLPQRFECLAIAGPLVLLTPFFIWRELASARHVSFSPVGEVGNSERIDAP